MASVFHGLGRCFVFAKYRTLYTYNGANYQATNGPQSWIFIGTAVTSPEVEIDKITTPITIDQLGPAPVNRLYNSEVHTVTITMNMLDYTNYLGLKARGTEAKGGLLRGDAKSTLGNLMVPVEDVELLLVWDALSGATDTPPGRRYFSATPLAFRETTENTRVLEASVAFQCIPIYVKKYKQPAPVNKPSSSTAKVIVADFPDPNKGLKITPSGFTVDGVTYSIEQYATLLQLRIPQEKPVVPKIDPKAPDLKNLNPVDPTSNSKPSSSPIPTDEYLYYLYTEIGSLF